VLNLINIGRRLVSLTRGLLLLAVVSSPAVLWSENIYAFCGDNVCTLAEPPQNESWKVSACTVNSSGADTGYGNLEEAIGGYTALN